MDFFCRCCSFIGRIKGYIQPISIGQYCAFSQVVHEIGHTLGYWHEQNRPDRDKYINILQNNIRPGYGNNFQKHSTSTIDSLKVPYDFNSIMHYGEYDFSKNPNLKTMSSKQPGIPLGKSSELSPLDILQNQLLYGDLCSKLKNIVING